MAKKDDYDWDDSLDWDDAYDEYDDSFEDVDDDRPVKKKSKSKTKTTKKSASGKSSSTRSSADKSEKKGKTKSSAKAKRRRVIMVLAIILEVIALAVVILGLTVSNLYNNNVVIDRDITFGPNGQAVVNEIPSGTIEKMKGYTTFAVFGLDARDMSNLGAGNNADVIILVSLNNDTGEINMVSVYRDTFLQIDSSSNAYGKINAAYSRGGALQAVEALNINLDVAVDHYVAVNWGAVVEAIDLLGGVDIEISESIYYAQEDLFGGTWLNSYIEQTARALGYTEAELAYITYPEGPGYQHLNGLQAVALCRIRQVGADYERTANQRAVISQLIQKAKNANPATLYSIAEQVLPNIATDVKLSYITSLLSMLSKVYVDQSAGFPSSRGGNEEDPVVSGGTEWKWCIFPKDLLSNVAEIHEILYNNYSYEPSSTVQSLSSQISALTGCYR